MSDYTKSGYTKTGKKVMCLSSNRRDLTYKKVYDVFTTQDSVDFIIDDVGDKRYESLEFPYWCEKSDDTVDTTNDIRDTNETKPKFKVGDTVKIVDIGYINDNKDNIPVVSDGGSSSYYAQQIPKGMLERFNATGTIEAKDVIRLFLGNDFNMGNIFKAYCRVISLRNGKGKAGIDEQYDLTKAKFFTEDELNYYLENKDV